MKKIDKIIIISYWATIVISIILVSTLYISDGFYRGGFHGNAIISFYIFIFLLLAYKKIYKNNLSRVKNPFTKKLKLISLVIFLSLVITLVISANIVNQELNTDYSDIYKDNFLLIHIIWSDFIGLIWPIITVLFLINFKKQLDISQRYQNLKDFVWSSLFLGLLINFSFTISFIIYDLELVVLLSFK